MGLQDWLADSGTIAAGSVCQAFEGRHYYRSMCLHKKGFDVLVQRRGEDVTNKSELVHPDLLSNPSESSSKALEHVTNTKEYKDLVTAVLSSTDTRSQMVVNSLNDVSTMLAIISAVRTGNITQHLQAERQMLKLIFTFDHIKYARYNSFQHAFGVIAAKPTDLHEAFSYPITSLPLSIASPASSLYQFDRAGFRNYVMKSSNSVSSSFLQNAK